MSNTDIQWESIDCPICQSKKYEDWLTTRDRFSTIDNQEFRVVRCSNCGFRFLNPRPDQNSIGPFYDHEEYDPFLSTKRKFSLRDTIYRTVRVLSLWRKRLLLEEFCRSGSLLDFGCGTGEFLSYMKSFQWNGLGVEPDEKSRKYAAGESLRVVESLESINSVQFNVITLWHVLEHIHHLHDMVKRLSSLLQPGGFLILAMPNIESHDAQIYGRHWIALDSPRHLYHFTEKTIREYFKSTSLRLIGTSGLFLDTIYNVVFSEQLRARGESRVFRPFQVFKTIINSYLQDAREDDRKASGSVYIFQKE